MMRAGDLRGFGGMTLAALALALLTFTGAWGGQVDGRLDIYWTDVEGGAATLIVTPAGESVLVDTGMPGDRDPGRICETVKKRAGLKKIDHLIISHFDIDHYGGTADLAKLVPIQKVYDPGLPKTNEKLMNRLGPYLKATSGKREVLRPGDVISLRQMEGKPRLSLKCLAAAQKFIDAPSDGKADNALCSHHKPKKRDSSENANSIVLLLTFGSFKFLDATDLTWNLEKRLVCPHNLVGTVDVYQVNHHGLDRSNNPVMIRSVQPRVAVMNNGARKGCDQETFKNLMETPSIKALYQLHRNIRVGPEGNTDPQRIANMSERCSAEIIQLSVHASGKKYSVSIPSKSLEETFETKS